MNSIKISGSMISGLLLPEIRTGRIELRRVCYSGKSVAEMLLLFQVKYKVLIITAKKLCRINLQNAIQDDYG
jgi:hypothetical protein